MRKIYACLSIFMMAIGCTLTTVAQTVAGDQLWQTASAPTAENLRIKASKFRTYQLALAGLKPLLLAAPMEFTRVSAGQEMMVDLPNPEGRFIRFKVVRTEVMAPELSARYGNIITLAGNAVADGRISVRLDVTDLGFHARVEGGEGELYQIDPAVVGNTSLYMVYGKSAVAPKFFREAERPARLIGRSAQTQRPPLAPCVGTQLKRYRLAVACNGEYAIAATGLASPTVAQTLSAIVTSVNRITGVYEKEVAIRLQLVANNDLVVYTNPNTDPFPASANSNAGQLIDSSQAIITRRIGSANYDIGHTFSTGTEGLAGLGVVCISSQKAFGVTGIPQPVGDPYDIDYVAHEFGHQFGANHTYNAATCSGPAEINTNAEPGGGTTIMAYAGICGNGDNVQNNSDPQFHAISFDEIVNYTSVSNGLSCATLLATGNAAPVVDAGPDVSIPTNTPIRLTGTATDANANPLTYSWEQVNTGGPTGPLGNPQGDAPIFRSLVPQSTGVRYLPRLTTVASNSTFISELTPTYARTLRFRLTARDNVANGAGVCYDENVVNVVNTGSAFRVLRPGGTSQTFRTGEYLLVTWNVAGTNAAPINTANVRIDILTSSGTVFTPLVVSTPNDGNEQVLLPTSLSGFFRIMVSGVNNVFYNLNPTNYNLISSPAGVSLGNAFANSNFSDSLSLCSGSNVVFQLNNTGINGYGGTATIAFSGAPAGLTIGLNKTNLANSDVTTVTATAAANLASGVYPVTFTITGAGGITDSRIINLVVSNLSDFTVQLASPANAAPDAPFRPTLRWVRNANASSYSLQLATDTNFTNVLVAPTGITDTFYNVITSLTTGSKYFWRVRPSTNLCGGFTGSFTQSRSFTVGKEGCDSLFNNTPVAISASGTPTVTSSITVANNSQVSSVTVGPVNITHTYINDLALNLIGPDQTTVQLISNPCFSQSIVYQNMLLRFQDGASTNVPCPPTNGATVAPVQPLAAFQNKASNGTWTLQVVDDANLDGGTLNSWSLKICRMVAFNLPIGWWNLQAQRTNEQTVQLNWATRNELNTSHFVVEKSTDGRQFTPLGQVKASGNTTQLTDYFFADAQAAAPLLYYRIQQVDADGRTSYSNVVTVKQGKVQQIQVLPNPVVNQLIVRSSLPLQQLQLFNAAGQQVMQARPGQLQAQMALNHLPNGFYTLRITTVEGVTVERISVQH